MHEETALSPLTVITGCDSGIGRSLCEVFTEHGEAVAASVLAEGSLVAAHGLFVKPMDLCQSDDIAAFAAFVQELTQQGYRLDTLINNAGIGRFGPVENLPLTAYRETFEVNFFGMVALTQKLLPGLIQNRGTIVIMGSLAGRVALPFLSPYTATKSALIGWGESLRRELRPLGVRTILVEPGAIATPIWNKGRQQDLSFVGEKYRRVLASGMDSMIDSGNQGLDPRRAAEIIYHIAHQKRPRARYIVSKSPVIDTLMTLVPVELMDVIIARVFRMHYDS
jgi:NAD(P)-dependent dehydrogenase (short-subunit alcohol dehydrogenase family)